MQPRHFLTLDDCTPEELLGILRRASELRRLHADGAVHTPLTGRVLGMIFEKSSTRTRVSFEAGMAQLGGSALFLSPRDTQLGRGEPIEDTARVISRMVDAVMIRTSAHDTVTRFADHSRVPVINGLTDDAHPCQLLADLQTYFEHRGDIRGRTVAWLGDGNNMCLSYMRAARLFDFRLRIAAPEGYAPDPSLVDGDRISLTSDPAAAVTGADLVVTDVWASMGFEAEQQERIAAFRPYQVDAGLMAQAAEDALFMHCLPAHRGEEVTAEVLEGAQSVVWDEAENRLHAQKALLELLLLKE
ncbi:Ornithine carbamoyltransferase, anabolic [wastewater metagenome]|uniref:ornithine carbamoyltransferase n=2 Tax=unclassified sequences TaxID=12908 RepID=A0A5B8RCC8_9ZZZZ|nr:ornithine carbamoyltransferase [Arhodomonas aquaeolei]QEA04347.1 ornithine carbamoyltransferase, anabolic [uncultured organism]